MTIAEQTKTSYKFKGKNHSERQHAHNYYSKYIKMEIKEIAAKALVIIKQTADYIRIERKKLEAAGINYKSDKSLVTSIDVGSEERLVQGLQALLPGSTILAEENHTHDAKSDLMWIIDPIDGTTNFVHDFPMYCISVALWRKGEIVFGVVYDIPGDECFWTHSDINEVYLNEKPVRVSNAQTLNESLLATGFPSSAFARMDEYIEHFRYFMQHTHGIRRLGSAALDLAYVACGRCDGFFEYNLKPWDVAAGAFLVQKAGGTVTDFTGNDNYLFGGEMLASNGFIQGELLDRFGNDEESWG